MSLIYSIIIRIYYSSIIIASLFNNKAKLWLRGRKNLFTKIKEQVNPREKIAWFHCASLGEFEQGRPVIEKFQVKFPQYKILLTFFSPSGYEIRKNYKHADYIFYLPYDFKTNAKRFIELTNPQIVFFIKYEFWHNYLKILHKKNIPTYLISAIFRKNQLFFKWYGGWYRKMLKYFTYLFVQNEYSKQLLLSIGITNVSVSGDTRFDRVHTIAQQSKKLPLIELFKQEKITVIAGSTWEKDEEILIKYINSTNPPLPFGKGPGLPTEALAKVGDGLVKFIIAPHEITSENINRICKSIKKDTLKYSKANEQNIINARILIIDNIGMLSSLYKYGSLAYIGGGFGKSIHNILEPASFGLPILFGPNYHKFQEAENLVELKGAYAINNYSELKIIIAQLASDKRLLLKSGQISKNYVDTYRGATDRIIKKIVSVHSLR